MERFESEAPLHLSQGAGAGAALLPAAAAAAAPVGILRQPAMFSRDVGMFPLMLTHIPPQVGSTLHLGGLLLVKLVQVNRGKCDGSREA